MSATAGTSLVKQFIDQFDIMLADTPERLAQVYRIRADVYCREFKFEPEENCPGGLERDQFDGHSVHCLIMHRELNLAAGCIRLILSPDVQPQRQLPFEAHCGDELLYNAFDPALLPRYSIAEYSRLAVHTAFRKPQADCTLFPACQTTAELDESERRCFSLLHTALFVAAAVLSEQAGRGHNFAMMEPRLARLLKCAAGFNFRQIGQLIDYHGLRAAFHITTEGMLSGMKANLWELYDFINARLATDFAQADYGFFTPVPAYALPNMPHFGLPPGPFNSTTLPSGSLI